MLNTYPLPFCHFFLTAWHMCWYKMPALSERSVHELCTCRLQKDKKFITQKSGNPRTIYIISVHLFKTNNNNDVVSSTMISKPGGGGYFRNFSVGMCRWDPGILSIYQSKFSWILLPYTRLNSLNIPLSYSSFYAELRKSKFADLIFLYFLVAIPSFPSLD